MYIDKSDEIVYKYNNTYHRAIKMKPVDVKSCTYIGAFKFNFDVKYLFSFLSCNMFEILFVYCLDILFPPILSFPWVADQTSNKEKYHFLKEVNIDQPLTN